MEIVVTDEFRRRYRLLPKDIQKKAEKQERLFRQNTFHPSLHTEKLEPRDREVWSFRIDRQYRVLFRFLGNHKVIFMTVGPHNWVYRISL